MRPLTAIFGRDLCWRKLGWLRRDYELSAGGEVVAMMRQHGFWRSQADIYLIEDQIAGAERQQAQSGNERLALTFWRSGVLRQQIHSEIHDLRLPGLKEVALSIGGFARLTLDNGRVYAWRPNFWQTDWALVDEADAEVARIRRKTWRQSGCIYILRADLDPDELLLLICLGWYLVIRKMEDAAAAAASAGGAG